jgi:hypothetical protein
VADPPHRPIAREPRRRAAPPGTLALWTGLLAGPIAWLLALEIAYVLVEASCRGTPAVGLHAASVSMLVAALAGGLLAGSAWIRAGAEWDDDAAEPESRRRFLAIGGMFTSALFSLAILGQWIATWIVSPCM